MTDFSYLDEFEVEGTATSELTLHEISVGGKSPTLIVSPATEANRPYINASLKGSKKRVRALRTGDLSADMIEDQRKMDKDLFPKFVVKNWYDMPDGEGGEVVFSDDMCRAFLERLPNHVFARVQEYCSDTSNFVAVVDVEPVVKNLQSD